MLPDWLPTVILCGMIWLLWRKVWWRIELAEKRRRRRDGKAGMQR
jgi:hypothetical protein